jgi:DNA-directed RNA polymerase subunit RPC12/RpoP
MNIEIKIGREVDGGTALRVAPNHKRVSRQHAIFRWQDGVATLEDTESSYGTFVNGRRIAKTKVTEDDVVWLGGINGGDDCFQLDMKKLFASCHEATDAQRTDYTDEFENIKQAYIDYQAEVSELKRKAVKKSQMPKLLASLIPAILGLVFFLVTLGDNDPNKMTLRVGIMVGGTAISGVVGVLTMGKSSAVNEQMSEEITELQIKYQKEYKCPKCGKDFNLNMHWKKLEAAGKCPHGCGAKFV